MNLRLRVISEPVVPVENHAVAGAQVRHEMVQGSPGLSMRMCALALMEMARLIPGSNGWVLTHARSSFSIISTGGKYVAVGGDGPSPAAP